MMDFRRVFDVEDGFIEIAPLSESYIQQCAALLCDTFIAALKAPEVYKGYLLKQVEEYLHTHYTLTPKCVVLTAVLHPDRKPAPGETEGEWGGKCEAGKEEGETHYMQDAEPLGDLVAAVEISFAPETRSTYLTLEPPPRCAYFCNMAVAERTRRRGIGNALLKAAEDVAREAGEREVFLHLRLKDKPAEAMYLKAGYSIQDTDNMLVPLIGIDRRHLMTRTLV